MSYRVIKPPPQLDHGPRGGAPLAICWHMAEGFNVALYLSRNPARGVSVNATVEGNGEIILMVPPTHIAGSINPRTLRTGDDPNGFYGRTARRTVLGSRETDPNRWVYAVEVAGKAVDGPNAVQKKAIAELTAYVRKMFPAMRGALGHRDFQDVKRCPGFEFPWDAADGHGLFKAAPTPEEAKPMATVNYDKDRPMVCTVKKGADLYDAPDGRMLAETGEEREEDYLGTTADGRFHLVSAIVNGQKRTAFISKGAMAGIPRDKPGAVDCAPLVTAETARVKAAAVAAVEAVQ